MKRFALLMLLVMFCLAAASCRKSEEVQTKQAESTRQQQPASTQSEEFKLTAENIAPRMYVPGVKYYLPKHFTIHFSRSVISQSESLNKPSDKTKVAISPPVAGKLVWDGTTILQFTPDDSFEFDTEYKLKLVSVDTMDGVIEAPEGDQWEYSFKTVPFKISNSYLEDMSNNRRKAYVIVDFTGPVSVDSLRDKVEVTINDQQASAVRILSGRREGSVKLDVSIPFSTFESKMQLKIAGGVKSSLSGYETAGVYLDDFQLKRPNRIYIDSVSRLEGENGHYIEVDCREENYSNYHRRCPIRIEDAASFVKISPEVKVSVANTPRGFRIFGNFKRGSYDLTLDPGLSTVNGSLLTSPYQTTINVPQRRPQVSFVSYGRYLPRYGAKIMPISHLNVDSVDLTVRKVPTKNIIFWLSGDSEKVNERTGDVIARKTIKVESNEDELITSGFDFREMVGNDISGVFELEVSAKGKSDRSRLILTDLAVVAKRFGQNQNDYKVWVFNNQTLEPVSGATVDFLTTSNRVIAACKTDSDGVCSLGSVADPLDDKKPFAMRVSAGDDLTVLKLDDAKLEISDTLVAGVPYKVTKPYRAAIYSDRGVYRPGEKVHLAALIRNDTNIAPDSKIPLIGILQDPRQKNVASLRATANEAGMVDFEYKLQDYSPTGRYKFNLEFAGEVIATYDFNVEEFVPERMKVDVSPLKDDLSANEQAKFKVSAHYLFGATAKGEKTELICTLEQAQFKPDHNGEFHYSIWRQEPLKPLVMATLNENLDDNGQAVIACPAMSESIPVDGSSQVKATASVFESGSGRTTVASASAIVHPEKFYIGLKSGQKEISTRDPVTIEGIVVDWQGNPVKDAKKVNIELLRMEMEWVYEYDPASGRHRYNRFWRPVKISQKDVEIANSRFSYIFNPEGERYGRRPGYIVRATSANARTDLVFESSYRRNWYEDRSSASNEHTPAAPRPGSLDLQVAPKIAVGSEIPVTINPPYPGRLLFTVETDEIVQSRWITVKQQPTTIKFELSKFAPNVYLSALLVKDPHQESQQAFMPDRSFGIRSVKVIPKQHTLDLKVNAPEKIKPNSKLTISVDAETGQKTVFVTVAAVDEGILQLTNFETPDPLSLLFARRGLGTQTFETVGWELVLPSMDNKESAGGDRSQESGPAGRVQPIKPVALYSGIVKLDANGHADISFEVPQYRGRLRIMAVAATPAKIGAAETSVLVRDPLVLQSTLPRFLLYEDRFVIPVFMTNISGNDETIKVTLQAEDSISIEQGDTRTVDIPDGESRTVTFVGKALRSRGSAKFKITARGKSVLSYDDAQIPFIPNRASVRDFNAVKLEDGTNRLDRFYAGFDPQYDNQTTISLTNNKYSNSFSHLKYLIRYPYGCIEQTTSSTPCINFSSIP